MKNRFLSSTWRWPPRVETCCSNFNLHNYSCVDGNFYDIYIYNELNYLSFVTIEFQSHHMLIGICGTISKESIICYMLSVVEWRGVLPYKLCIFGRSDTISVEWWTELAFRFIGVQHGVSFFGGRKNLALLAPGTTGCGERREVGVPLVWTFSATWSNVLREAERSY